MFRRFIRASWRNGDLNMRDVALLTDRIRLPTGEALTRDARPSGCRRLPSTSKCSKRLIASPRQTKLHDLT
jgi:hypothetical protein